MPAWAATFAMPEPIMPAPTTPSLRTALASKPSGRLAPPFTWLSWKKNAVIMFLATGCTTSDVKLRLSMRSAVSKSSRPASTMVSRMRSGAGRRPRVFWKSMAEPAAIMGATRGELEPPPGILWPFWSQGCTAASGFSRIHSLARGTSASSASTVSWMRPASTARAGSSCLPSVRKGMAPWSPSRWVRRTTPPPPGSRPRVTSGRPIFTRLSFTAMRWLQQRQIS